MPVRAERVALITGASSEIGQRWRDSSQKSALKRFAASEESTGGALARLRRLQLRHRLDDAGRRLVIHMLPYPIRASTHDRSVTQ